MNRKIQIKYCYKKQQIKGLITYFQTGMLGGLYVENLTLWKALNCLSCSFKPIILTFLFFIIDTYAI